MFEAISRSGCGRTGKLSGEGWQLQTPNVLYLNTGRFPAPEHSEAVLASAENKMCISIDGTARISFPGYSGFPFNLKSGNEPNVLERACVIRPETNVDEIIALRGQIDLFVLENSIELYQNAKLFVDTLVRVRQAIGYRAALYLPGIALPNNIALLGYMGVDLLDSARVALLSGQGLFMTQDGISDPGDEYCVCKACAGKMGAYSHNLMVMQSELMRTRSKIANGGIREHIEYRAKTSPKLVEMLRHLDMHNFQYQEERTPVVSSNFAATTRLALGRPDIVRFRNRVIERYAKPPTPDVLVLLPCSAKKPYSSSKSHGFFARAISESGAAPRVHEVIVTSPVGLVPRELELFYPAQHYDIPVTGHWFEDEKLMINNLLQKYLNNNKYKFIINHLGDELIEGLDARNTVAGSPTSDESLNNLTRALSEISGTGSGWKNRASEELASMAAFQFGTPAREIFSECAMAGRFPQVRIVRNRMQLATISQANGMLVPTIDGARLLAEAGIHVVNIENFDITGNLFAVGVTSASPEIRVGDEVVIVRNGETVAAGTARMSGDEMTQANRGEAVRVRHKAH
jgi:archaeosine synthase